MREITEVAQWFITIKAPDLKDKVEAGLKSLNDGIELESNYKKLFGFMLFSYSMNHGPASFIGIQFLAEDLKIMEELKEYAQDWINHSKLNSEQNPERSVATGLNSSNEDDKINNL